jgi:hypothetical protein
MCKRGDVMTGKGTERKRDKKKEDIDEESDRLIDNMKSAIDTWGQKGYRRR